MKSTTALSLLQGSTGRGEPAELTYQPSGSTLLRTILGSRTPLRRGGGVGALSPARSTVPPVPLETAVDLQRCATPYGEAAVVRRRFRLDTRHGERCPADLLGRSVDRLLTLTNAAPSCSPDPRRWMFVDTEATGLGGWAGNLAFIMSFGFFEDDMFVIDQCVVRGYDAARLRIGLGGRWISQGARSPSADSNRSKDIIWQILSLLLA